MKIVAQAGASCVFAMSLCNVAAAAIAPAAAVVPVKAYAPLTIRGAANYAFATGTWDHNAGSTANAVEITCYRTTKDCTESEALLSGEHLIVRVSHWTVVSWTPSEVEAEQKESCITATLTINFTQQEVLQVMRNGGLIVGKCVGLERLKAPNVWKLIAAEAP
jgi:hypothetical protein